MAVLSNKNSIVLSLGVAILVIALIALGYSIAAFFAFIGAQLVFSLINVFYRIDRFVIVIAFFILQLVIFGCSVISFFKVQKSKDEPTNKPKEHCSSSAPLGESASLAGIGI